MAQDGDFQRRAGEEGRQAHAIAGRILRGCGFEKLRSNERLDDLGLTVNYIAEDRNGRDWHFDVSGAFTSRRAGLIRTDTMWKTLGRANVLHQAGIERLVLMTTNLPKSGLVVTKRSRAAPKPSSTPWRCLLPGKHGFGCSRPPLVAPSRSPLRAGLQRRHHREVGTELEVRVPLGRVRSVLPARASLDV